MIMTTITAEDLTRMVMRLMDENPDAVGEEGSYGSPLYSLSSRIGELLPGVAEEVVREASVRELDEYMDMNAVPEWVAPGRGVVELPRNFCRLVAFKMSDWSRTVCVPMEYESAQYQLRFNMRGRSGIAARMPAVSLMPQGSGMALEFIGSTEPGAYVEKGFYVPVPYDAEAELYRLPRRLVVRVAQAAARLAAAA